MSSPIQFSKAAVDAFQRVEKASPSAVSTSKILLDNKTVFKATMPKCTVVTLQTYNALSTLEKRLAAAVIGAMQEVMANDKSALKGVWYPEDLALFYAKLQQTMPQDHWDGYLDPTYFQKTGKFTWVLKEGKSAAKAIGALFQGPSVLDCGNAVHACYYKALLEIFGEEKFDFLFGGDLSRRLAITKGGAAINDNPLYGMVRFSFKANSPQKGSKERNFLTVGEDCHIAGLPFYPEKHPKGFGGGWNVIYVGNNSKNEPLFIGHGFDRALTEMEIVQMLIDEYNKERTAEEETLIQRSGDEVYDKNKNKRLKNYYTFNANELGFVLSYLKRTAVTGLKYESVKSSNVAMVANLMKELRPRDTQRLERLFKSLGPIG